jgi:alkylation response protein AidB-like acyl-CoA dehydrogenase
MSEDDIIGPAIARIFSREATAKVRESAEDGVFPERLWQALAEAGALHPSAPAEARGAGGEARDELAVLREVGRAAAPGPIADTMLAGLMLSRAGVEIPSGPLASVSASTRSNDGDLIERAAWGRAVKTVVLVGENDISVLPPGVWSIRPGRSLSGEPWDEMVIRGRAPSAMPLPGAQAFWRARGALIRAAMMSGALDAVLAMCIKYVNDRVQFGRPIGKFQAIQHMSAQMAGETVAASMAVDLAYASLTGPEPRLDLLAGVAKSRVGEAAGWTAAAAHQIHGAIGFSHEYELQALTRRLWTWRDEFGSESDWNDLIGRTATRAGADGHWALIVDAGAA